MTAVERRTVPIVFEHDPAANAAAITFDPHARGRDLATRPVADDRGDVIAVVTFDPSGKLVQIELLDAEA